LLSTARQFSLRKSSAYAGRGFREESQKSFLAQIWHTAKTASRSPEKIINHVIGLTPRAVEILKSLPRTDSRVFPMTANAFRLAFNRARAKAGVPHFHFHDTRHERTSSLFEANWSMVQVMAQTGHKDPKSVKRYANLAGDFLADQLAKLEQRKTA